MEMVNIYKGIEENLKEIEPELKKQQDKVAELEKAIEEAMAELEKAEAEKKIIQSRFDALMRAKEALETAEFPRETEKKDIEKTTGATILQKPVKQIPWTRKNGTLVQMDRHGNLMNKYGSQAAAARQLNWDQSSISRFMKLNSRTQIERKGFTLKWVP